MFVYGDPLKGVSNGQIAIAFVSTYLARVALEGLDLEMHSAF